MLAEDGGWECGNSILGTIELTVVTSAYLKSLWPLLNTHCTQIHGRDRTCRRTIIGSYQLNRKDVPLVSLAGEVIPVVKAGMWRLCKPEEK